METNLVRLVYYSHNRLSDADHAAGVDIEAILAASRRNNAEVQVTGALMFNSGFFAQVLEGPEPAVAATFERIQQDPRHGDVNVLSFGPVASRAFSNWSMALVGGAVSDRRYQGMAGESGFDPAALSGDRVFGILRDLLTEDSVAVA